MDRWWASQEQFDEKRTRSGSPEHRIHENQQWVCEKTRAKPSGVQRLPPKHEVEGLIALERAELSSNPTVTARMAVMQQLVGRIDQGARNTLCHVLPKGVVLKELW